MAVRKQRLDKYYNLAKEKGYRARSAFKLIELNRKYNFLANAHIAVDLCAAPGGWMQILAQEMPSPRKIIGIDLDPIKPLGSDVISFVGDITTVECRKTLIKHLSGHQVDVFVHDGAPNFGAARDTDVFIQNDLVLAALKLTTEFLKEGGTFVTKIFRSENFFKITNVFETLFENVYVTKPLSSRDESAEIFAVCLKFKNPEFIDPTFFNSEILFKDNTPEIQENMNILLSSFIKEKSNKILKNCAKIIVDFECELIDNEFKELFKDLKIINDSEFRKIYRLKEKIIKKVKNGSLNIPLLEDVVIEPISEKEEKILTLDDKINEIEKLEASNKKENTKQIKNKALSNITTARNGFFEDRIFKNFDSTEIEKESSNSEVEEYFSDSCSDSLELTESELKCAIMMKEMGDKFVETTIDRNMIDSDDIVLPCEKRPVKMDEFNAIPKNKADYIQRKKSRAARRAGKAMAEIQVEDEEEEAVIHKKIFKNMYKKQRNKLKTVFIKKGQRFHCPKGKGKVLCLDKRMKHDLRISKQRNKKHH